MDAKQALADLNQAVEALSANRATHIHLQSCVQIIGATLDAKLGTSAPAKTTKETPKAAEPAAPKVPIKPKAKK